MTLTPFGAYRVIDIKTGRVVATAANLKHAYRIADRLGAGYVVTRLAWGSGSEPQPGTLAAATLAVGPL